jgi:hypothetical protein
LTADDGRSKRYSRRELCEWNQGSLLSLWNKPRRLF